MHIGKHVAAACAAVLLGCGSSTPVLEPAPPPPVATVLQLVTDTVRTAGVAYLQVRVLDQYGEPMANVPVDWSVLSGRGLLRDVWTNAHGGTLTTKTARSGTAHVYFGAGPGRHRVRAAVEQLPPVMSVIDMTTLSIAIRGSGFGVDGTQIEFTAPLGSTIEWVFLGMPDWLDPASSSDLVQAHVVSASAPTPESHFDSGVFGDVLVGDAYVNICCFRFTPTVAGIWEFENVITGSKARLVIEDTETDD